MDANKNKSKPKRKSISSNHSNSNNSGTNGFKALGLSDDVYRGIVKMGFRVSLLLIVVYLLICLNVVVCVLM